MTVMTRHRPRTGPRFRRHPFVPDLGLQADPYTHLAVCVTCHKPGRAGDAQHLDPIAPELAAAVRERDHRILGERIDDDE